MTQVAPFTPTSSEDIERSRQVEQAAHSLRMEGLELAPDDAADAADYAAGRLTLEELGRRTRSRYGVLN